MEGVDRSGEKRMVPPPEMTDYHQQDADAFHDVECPVALMSLRH